MYICRQDLVVPEGPLRVPRPAKPPPVDREGHPEHLRVPWLWNLGMALDSLDFNGILMGFGFLMRC